MNEITAPSPYRVEAAMSAAMQLRDRLLEQDPTMLEDTNALIDTLDGETDALEIVRRLVRYSMEQQSLADAAEARVRALEARQARFEQRVAAARITARDMLEALGIAKVTAEDFTVSVRPGKPTVQIVEPERIPEEFVRVVTTRTVDKPLVKAALDRGETVEGACWSNGAQPVLSVRSK